MLEARQLVVNQLQEESTTDPLTGLGNRRILAGRRQGSQESTTAVMVDLDHFKAYNDLHGHRAGDELLVDFSAVLASCIRADDLLVRYGGEEFCMILSCDLPLAETLTARIREIWSGHHADVTFSAGICEVAEGESLGVGHRPGRCGAVYGQTVGSKHDVASFRLAESVGVPLSG
ncbi:MAG: GGDEF domain-containing protein [Acidimicrobiales bacterium]